MGSNYRSVLRRRDVLAVLAPYVFARLPLSMSLLAVLLLVRTETGSYHDAGLVCAGYGVAVALTAPILGRIVDRRGQSPVLVVCGFLHPSAMAVLAVSAAHHRLPFVLAGAVLSGASLPPVSSCMRVLWTFLLPAQAVGAGYAIEGVVVEVAELTGPLLVSAAILASGPAAAVICSGATTGVATLLFSRSPASRAVPVAAERRPWAGPLAVSGVRLVLLMVVAMSVTVGGVEVAIVAFARSHGGSASAGLYIAMVSVGGIAAGLLAGSRASGSRYGGGVLGAASVATAGAAAALAAAPAVVVLLPLLVAFGAMVALTCIVQLALLARAAPAAVRTEAFTWGTTANFVGLGAGSLLAGFVVDAYGSHVALLVAAAPSVVAAVAPLFADRVGGRAVEAAATGADLQTATGIAALHDELVRLRAQVTRLQEELMRGRTLSRREAPTSSVAPGRPVLVALPGIGLTAGGGGARRPTRDEELGTIVDEVLGEAADADTR